jgi:hypothetical protein
MDDRVAAYQGEPGRQVDEMSVIERDGEWTRLFIEAPPVRS